VLALQAAVERQKAIEAELRRKEEEERQRIEEEERRLEEEERLKEEAKALKKEKERVSGWIWGTLIRRS
jgi:translation initiation factor 5B